MAYVISMKTQTHLPVSLCIIAKNAEKTLKSCILSASSFISEVIVVVNDCTDNTKSIAQSCKAKVYEHPFEGDRQQRNIALSYATQEWILVLDSDEQLSLDLQTSIKNFFQNDYLYYQGAYFSRKSLFLNSWINHGDWYPDHCVRLFKRGLGSTEGMPRHPYVKVNGKLKKLKGDILHYTAVSLDAQIMKISSFSDDFLTQQLKKKKKFSLLNAIFRSFWRFFRGYFLRLGFLDGYRGFYLASLSFFSTLHRYSRLFEHEVKDKCFKLNKN